MTLYAIERETKDLLQIVAGHQGDVEGWRENVRLKLGALGWTPEVGAEAHELLGVLDEELATEAYRLGELLAQIQEFRAEGDIDNRDGDDFEYVG